MIAEGQAVAVTGATGRVGSRLLPPLLAAGRTVLAISRRPRADGPGRVRWLRAEVAAGWPEEAEVARDPLRGPARRARRGPRASAAAAPCADWLRCPRSAPACARVPRTPQEVRQAARLLAAESALAAWCRERGVSLCVVRATAIYDDEDLGALEPLLRIAARLRILPLPWPARGLRQPVHAGDLAALLLALLGHAHEGVIEAGGGERLDFATMLRRAARARVGRCLPLPLPTALLALLAPRWRGAVARLARDQVAEPAPVLAELGWCPRPFAPPSRRPAP
ncbi:MAG: hypothetical protein RML12_10640 [Xanthomonadales bacterium]|nr:hypothetical protein [Xanthomonadales bacterium]